MGSLKKGHIEQTYYQFECFSMLVNICCGFIIIFQTSCLCYIFLTAAK